VISFTVTRTTTYHYSSLSWTHSAVAGNISNNVFIENTIYKAAESIADSLPRPIQRRTTSLGCLGTDDILTLTVALDEHRRQRRRGCRGHSRPPISDLQGSSCLDEPPSHNSQKLVNLPTVNIYEVCGDMDLPVCIVRYRHKLVLL